MVTLRWLTEFAPGNLLHGRWRQISSRSCNCLAVSHHIDFNRLPSITLIFEDRHHSLSIGETVFLSSLLLFTCWAVLMVDKWISLAHHFLPHIGWGLSNGLMTHLWDVRYRNSIIIRVLITFKAVAKPLVKLDFVSDRFFSRLLVNWGRYGFLRDSNILLFLTRIAVMLCNIAAVG